MWSAINHIKRRPPARLPLRVARDAARAFCTSRGEEDPKHPLEDVDPDAIKLRSKDAYAIATTAGIIGGCLPPLQWELMSLFAAVPVAMVVSTATNAALATRMLRQHRRQQGVDSDSGVVVPVHLPSLAFAGAIAGFTLAVRQYFNTAPPHPLGDARQDDRRLDALELKIERQAEAIDELRGEVDALTRYTGRSA